jgi:hypothetical protein
VTSTVYKRTINNNRREKILCFNRGYVIKGGNNTILIISNHEYQVKKYTLNNFPGTISQHVFDLIIHTQALISSELILYRKNGDPKSF